MQRRLPATFQKVAGVVLLGTVGVTVGLGDWAPHFELGAVAAAAVIGWIPGLAVFAVSALTQALRSPDGWSTVGELSILAFTAWTVALVLRRPFKSESSPRRDASRIALLALIAASAACATPVFTRLRWDLSPITNEFLYHCMGISLAAVAVWLPWPRSTRAHALWAPTLALATTAATMYATVGFWQDRDESLLQLTADSTASGFLTELTDQLNLLEAKAATAATTEFSPDSVPSLVQTLVFGNDPITSVSLLEFPSAGNPTSLTSVSAYGPDFEQALQGWINNGLQNGLVGTEPARQTIFLGTASLPIPTGDSQPQYMYFVPLAPAEPGTSAVGQGLVASISIPSLVAKSVTASLGALNQISVTLFELGIDSATPVWTASTDSSAQGILSALDPVDPIPRAGRSAATELSVDVIALRLVAERGASFGTPLTTRRLVVGLEFFAGFGLFAVLLQTTHEGRRREEDRRRREALLATALENSPGWNAIIDSNDRVLVGNHDDSGVPVGHHLENAPVWVADHLTAQRVLEAVRRSRDGATESITVTPRTEQDDDAALRIYEVLARPINTEGGEPLVFLQCVDVTERRNLAMRTAQSERMESIGLLAGSLAHDFNNLLFITQGYLQMMERQPKVANDPQLNRFVTRAAEAVERGATIAKSLLAVARSQPLSNVPINVREFLTDLEPLITQALAGNEAILLVEETATPDLDVVVDPGRLSSAVLNLVFNARDAMEGGGLLTIRAERTIAGEHPDESREMIVLQVQDTGKGMSPEVVARAYEPFFTTGKIGKGTGLGLSAVYSFAQQSGGWTTIESREGLGTTVSIFLNPAIATIPTDHPARLAQRANRALVVDDEEALADLVAGWLGELGFETRRAYNSATALNLAREFQPDLLISDANIGEQIDGAEMAAQITEFLPTLVTVFMTGFSDRLRALEMVGAMTLAKPFSRDDLEAALDKLMGPRTPNRQQDGSLQ